MPATKLRLTEAQNTPPSEPAIAVVALNATMDAVGVRA